MVGIPTRAPVNTQAFRAIGPAPWWARLNDPEFCGRHIQELENQLASAKATIRDLEEKAAGRTRRVNELTETIKKLEARLKVEVHERMRMLDFINASPASDEKKMKAIDKLMSM